MFSKPNLTFFYSEVLKIYLEKKNEVTKLSAKYQTLLDKYSDKCKELDKLTKEYQGFTLKHEELQSKIKILQQQHSKTQSDYEQLEKTYNSEVNSTACKYQSINQSLIDMTKKYKQELKHVAKLEATINNLKNNSIKSPKKGRNKIESTTEEDKNEIEKLRADNNEINHALQMLTKKNSEQLKHIEEMKNELDQLQIALKFVSIFNVQYYL